MGLGLVSGKALGQYLFILVSGKALGRYLVWCSVKPLVDIYFSVG